MDGWVGRWGEQTAEPRPRIGRGVGGMLGKRRTRQGEDGDDDMNTRAAVAQSVGRSGAELCRARGPCTQRVQERRAEPADRKAPECKSMSI